MRKTTQSAGETIVTQNVQLKSLPQRLGSPRGLIAYAPNLENQMRVTTDMIVYATQITMEPVLA